jgi:hypothetical protein
MTHMNRTRVTCLILSSWALLLANCAHGPCKALGSLFGCRCETRPAQPELQDMSIQLPAFDGTRKADAVLDGNVFRAIRIAADDLLPPEEPGLPCLYQKSSYRYQAVRQGEMIFVRMDFDPRNCGGNFGMLDGGATYAISLNGQILRRAIDGTEPLPEPPPARMPEEVAPAPQAPSSAAPPEPSSPQP